MRFLRSFSFLRHVDRDTQLTVVALSLAFVTWTVDILRDTNQTERLMFPMLVLFNLSLYLLIVSAGLKHAHKVDTTIKESSSNITVTLPDAILRGLNLTEEFRALGVRSISSRRNDDEFLALLRSSEKEVCILAVTFWDYARLIRGTLPDRLVASGANVRMLIFDRDCEFLTEKNREDELDGRIHRDLGDVTTLMGQMLTDAKRRGYSGSFEVRQYSGMTYCSLYIFDNHRIWYNPYLRTAPGKNVPVYQIDQTFDGIYPMLAGHFEAVWNDETTRKIFNHDDVEAFLARRRGVPPDAPQAWAK